MNKHTKTTSVVLAIILQLAPMARQVITQIAGYAPNIAVIFRWGIGLSALLGGVDAVSGASTVITSASTASGTVGVPFTFRLITGPHVATSYTASPLPPGLTLTASTGRITGTPTQPGVTVAAVRGCDGGNGCTPNAKLTITIIAGGPTPPSITSQPGNVIVTAGNPATFSVTATGATPLSYQWRFNATDIAGATASSYTIASAQAANAGTYSVVVGNSAGTVTSANATLTVNPAPIAPSITTQPASQTVNAGSGAMFNVAASGTAPLFYQWRFNAANISGATAASYTIVNCQPANAGNYSVLVSNIAGSVTSAAAALSVTPEPPAITTPPASQTVFAGTTVNFSVVVSGTLPMFYQWSFNGAPLAGATSSTLALSNVQAANAGTYSVLVSNSVGSVASASATLTVNPPPPPPAITADPVSQTVATGGSVTFSVTATGSTLSYQWKFNAANLAGATSSTLTLNNVQAAKAGNYSVAVSNAGGTVTSASATLTVLPPPPVAPSIVTPPASQTAVLGGSATFTVSATGTGPLSYQWQFNGGDIAGATSASFTIASVQNSDAGSYDVVVNNAVGSATSAAATLSVVVSRPAAGVYQGLFYDTNNVALASSGYLWLTLDGNANFNAILSSGTEQIPFTGQFDGAGHAVATSLGSQSLAVDLQLDLAAGGDNLTGHVTDGSWTATLVADRQVVVSGGTAPFAGNYNLVFQGLGGGGDGDGDGDGDRALSAKESDHGGSQNGRGTARISRKGILNFRGTFGNGVTLRQKSAVSKTGDWPFYVVLSRNRGVVIGWIQVSQQPSRTASGDLMWFLPDGTVSTLTVTGP